MVLASGTQASLRYVEEVTRGTTPAGPAMKVLRATGRNINGERDTLETDEVRPTGQVSDVRLGFARVVGAPGFELSLESYDDIFPLLLRNTWNTVPVSGSPNFGSTAPDTFTRDAGSFVTDDFRPGDIILTTGYSNGDNNGQFRVTAVTATDLTVDSADIATEAAGAGPSLIHPGQRLETGTTLKTLTVERAFEDITQYQRFQGCSINQGQISIRPGSMIGGSFSILGMSTGLMTGTPLDATPTAAPTTSPMSTFVGTAHIGGVANAFVTQVDFTINNNNSTEGVFGTPFSPDVFQGTQRVSGTMTVFMEDATEFNKFVNETESSVWLKAIDVGGEDFIDFKFPRVKYLNANIDPPQQGPISLVLPFLALEDTTYGVSVVMQRSNV